MAGCFCTDCGERLPGGVRFCPNCGSSAAAAVYDKVIASVKDADWEARLGVKLRTPVAIRDPGAQEEKRSWGVSVKDLNDLLACSLMNAPMDTEFLILLNEQQHWIKWTPLVFIENMQGLKASGHGSALYGLGDQSQSPSVCDHFRSLVISEARDAFINIRETPGLCLELYPFFKPMDYGQLDHEIRGRWVTTVDDQRNFDIVSVLPLPLSGWTMKQRLLQHETVIKKWIASTDDRALKDGLNNLLNVLQSVVKQTPDGLADHMLCRAHVIENGQVQSTALSDEEPETVKSSVREVTLEKISQPLAFRAPLCSTMSASRAGLSRRQVVGTRPIAGAAPYGAIPKPRFPFSR